VNAVQIITWVGYAVALYWSVRFFVWTTFFRGEKKKEERATVHNCPGVYWVKILTLEGHHCTTLCVNCDHVTYQLSFLTAGNNETDIAAARLSALHPTHQEENRRAQEDTDPAPVRDDCARCDDDARISDGGRNCPDHITVDELLTGILIGDANRIDHIRAVNRRLAYRRTAIPRF
jgi:hypothetical protein